MSILLSSSSPSSSPSPIQMLVTLLLLLLASTTEAGQSCSLCGSHSTTPNWDNVASTAPFMTCRQVYFQLATLDQNDHRCSPLQQQFNGACCGSGGSAYKAPPGQQTNNRGSEPTCHICKDGSYPGKPNQFISARYVGSHSCGTLYQRGLNGQIPGFMCGPLQHNLQQSCGCGQYAPPPTPAPVRPPPTPTRRPTRPPTRPPTRRPSPRPTPYPTRPPTPSPTPSPTKPPTKPPTRPPTVPPTIPPTEYMAIARKEVPTGDNGKDGMKRAPSGNERNYGQRRGLKEALVLQTDPQESE